MIATVDTVMAGVTVVAWFGWMAAVTIISNRRRARR